MDDLLRDFLTESAENLSRLDNDLVQLERRPGDLALLNGIFRTIHTIKGTCGFIGLTRLESLAHAAENVLDALRAGEIPFTTELIEVVLAAIDTIKGVLAHLEVTETEQQGDDSELIARLAHCLQGVGPKPLPRLEQPMHRAAAVPDPIAAPVPIPAVVPAVAALSPAPSAARAGDEAAPEPRGGVADSTLRVGVGLLDRLMNLVGELALSRNQLLQLAAANDDSEFAKPVQHLDRVTTDLLEAVMKTRMQPIGNAWTKLPRVVRDLSHTSGKQITLELIGAETELDRQILQAIQDPLTHMIRNSADHGIELPATRRAAGKTEGGTIRLSARHEGGHVVIEIADDGAGINVDRVRRKAVERGLLKADAAEAMAEAQVLRLIFEPGFSTAEQVTNVSGRGVGMDVVRSNIEVIGGTVELASKDRRGTTVRVKIPLTLAIISSLVVGCSGETFAVPQIGVVELVRVGAEQQELIETVHGARFYRLRESLLPLVALDAVLGLPAGETRETYNIVVCQVGESRFGLVVEEVFDTQEIVVKPVGRLVKHLQAYAGCTITGDGRVIMILDTAGVATLAGVARDEARGDDADAITQSLTLTQDQAKESVLLFDAGYPALQAVPLSLVARLEMFPLSEMEEADGHFLVQYRGALIPVLPANPALDMRAIDPRPVLVFSDRDRTMGVAVNEIRDIVEDHIKLERGATRPGVLGVSVIAERATEVIDTDHFLRLAHTDWFASQVPGSEAAGPLHILLVDDSRFFLSLLAPSVRNAGYLVSTVTDGAQALARLEHGERVDVIVSDIDMPVMGGCELATAVRANPRWSDVALIALTARSAPDDAAAGLAAGFDRYLTKLDRVGVLATIRELTTHDRVPA